MALNKLEMRRMDAPGSAGTPRPTASGLQDMSITKLLLDRGLLTKEQLDEAIALNQAEGLRLDRAIIQLGYVSERQLLEIMSEQLNLPLVSLAEKTIDPQALQALPAKVVYRKRLVPVSRVNGTLNVATSDAFDLNAFADLRLITGLNVQPVLALREDIEKVIKAQYGLGGDTLEEMVGDDADVISASGDSSEDLLEMAQEASVIKLVNEIILEAVNERASDIH